MYCWRQLVTWWRECPNHDVCKQRKTKIMIHHVTLFLLSSGRSLMNRLKNCMNHCIGFLIFRINIINNCWIIKCHYGREIFWCNVIITTRENEDPFPNVQMCSAETGQTGASHHCWPVASIFCQNYFPLCRQASWAQTCYISSPGPTAPWELRRKMATINIL